MSEIQFPNRLSEILAQTKRICIFTGAGMSAESGIATFRGAGNLWDKFKPEELATPEAFLSHPARVQEWYAWRRQQVKEADIHDGHRAISELENSYSVDIVTQNVDRLHQRAGSQSVIELHGNILDQYCFSCGETPTKAQTEAPFPSACSCGGYFRPAVVWFGEQLPDGAMHRAEEMVQACDLFISIGTMGAVYPAAGLVQIAAASDAYTVEINIERSMVSDLFDLVLLGSASKVLSLLSAKVNAQKECAQNEVTE